MASIGQSPTRFSALASSLIVSCMVACGMVTIAQLGSLLLPGWRGGYLVVVGFFISLEVFFTERFRKRLVVFDSEWFIFYLSEWLVYFILLKAILLFRGGLDRLLVETTAWRVDFFGSFFNGELLFSLVVIFAAWLVSLSFAAPLETLRLDLGYLQIEEDAGLASERAQARQQLVDLVLLTGMVLVVLTSLMRSDRVAGWVQIPVLRAGVVNVMIYFMLGLVLLSLTQFIVLQVRWSLSRISVGKQIAHRWALFSLLFLALVAGISLWLPTGYTISLLTLLNWLVGGVAAALALISWLVTAAFMAIIALLGTLMGRPQEEGSLPPAPLPTQLPQVEAIEINSLPAVIRSILFWAILVGVASYLLYYFIKIRRQDISQAMRLPLVAWLANIARWVRDWLSSFGRQARGALQAGVQRLRRTAQPAEQPPAWRYASLRRLTPRQRVVFYYLALVRRGAESGLPRQPAQTPYEYAEQVRAAMASGRLPAGTRPAEQELGDLENITDGFLEARYSLHEVTDQQAGGVKESWQRLKRLFRRK